jgi:hypothetical protein
MHAKERGQIRSTNRSGTTARSEAPATVIFMVNGKQVNQGRIERSMPGLFTASETLDVGLDLGSPVALDFTSVHCSS